MSERYAGPPVMAVERAARLLERNHDDGQVRDALGRLAPLVRDAITGEVQPCWHYRLECGRIETVWTTPLPEGKTWLYCPDDGCRRERRIVETLTDDRGDD